MTATQTSRQITRYVLSDLALRSAVALERFALGEPLNCELVADFAEALSGTSHATGQGDQTRYFAVGYHSSYMRLGFAKGVNQSVDEVQDLLDSKAKSLTAFLANPDVSAVSELAEFCTELHHELAQSQIADIRLAKRPRNRSEVKRLTPRFGTAANTRVS